MRAQDATAATDPDARARRAFEAGRDAYEHGSFATALVYFEQAYALRPSPELLYKVGRAADSDGQPGRAIAAYSSYLESYPDASNRDFVRARLEKMRALEQAHSSLARADSAPPTARRLPEPAVLPASADGAQPQQGPLLAGRAPGLPVHGARDAVPDDTERVRPAWKSAWLWTAVGALVAGGVVAGVLASRQQDPQRAAADAYVVIPEAP